MNKDFVHLHLHTDYSMMDGCQKMDVMFKTLNEKGMNKVAITNHGNMINMPKLINQGARPPKNKKTEKPEWDPVQVIPGCEFYICWDHPATIKDSEHKKTNHMVALAMNEVGYRNLMALTTKGYTIGKYFKPRIDRHMLEEHSEGLIILTACLNGTLASQLAKEGKCPADLVNDIRWMKEVFGDRVYLEVQRHPNLPLQDKANQGIIELAKKFDMKTVATCDAHYSKPEHFPGWQAMMLLQTNFTFGHELENDYYIKSAEQMYDLWKDMPEVCETTVEIANRCEPIVFDNSIKYPPFNTGRLTPDEYLRKSTLDGLEERISRGQIDAARKQEYLDRIDYELKVLAEKNFSSYILIVADYTVEAKRRDIYMSPGRGSGAGSLVCYLTKITEVDPLRPGYDLIFERFINPERDSFPDIDQDFQHDRRGEMIDYCVDKYGEDKVAYIMTIGTMGAKNALRDVGRRFGLTPFEVNELSKAVPPAVRGRSPSLADALKDDKFLEKLNSDSRYQQVYDVATIIEGMAKSTGVHAAGVLIGDERPIVEQLPCMTDKEDKIVAAVEGPIAEAGGYIKFDFLGLKTQTTLHKTVDWIHLNHGVKIDLDMLEDGDEKVYDMMCDGFLAGLFQLSGSSGFREVTMKMKPRDIPGIADITSIYRPGPLDNGFVPKYVNNVNRVARGLDIIYEMKVDNPKVQKEVEKILAPTYGVCLYQEQIQFIAQEVAGYSLGGADLLRRAIGKKKMSEMEAQKKMFINGAKKNGVSETSAKGLFAQIEKFADYCFNKSHAIAYSIITYQTAWLKYYYPTEFFAACLTEVQDNQDKTVGFITACKREGIKILPPDINKSDIEYTPTEEGIIFGLGAIKGVGEAAIRPILEARKDGKFKSFFDFMSRVNLTKVKKSDIKVLVEAGCFNSLM